MSVKPVPYFSGALYRRQICFVYLPPDYDCSTRSYPVIYLLHGMHGNESDWLERGGAERTLDTMTAAGALRECIVVMPSDGGYGHGTFYTDWYDGTGNFEQSFVFDLMPHIEAHFRTIADRTSRALCGLSMGGFGSFSLALRFPEYFGCAASLSGAVGSPAMLPARDFARSEFARMTGPKQGPYARERDLYVLSKDAAERSARPALYMSCGTEDYLLDMNRLFHQHLMTVHYPHRYREHPGAHDWSYWTEHLTDALAFIEEQFYLAD